jgi:alpha-tubulin suppressor-like RCC1 family protein
VGISDIASEIRRKRAYIWAFGKNSDGELGISSQKDQFMPKPIVVSNLKTSAVAKWISSGSHHSAIVTKNGEVFVSGS